MQPILIVDPSAININDLANTEEGKVALVRLRPAGYGMLGKMDSMAWLQCLIVAWSDTRGRVREGEDSYIKKAEELYKEYIRGLYRTQQLEIEVYKEDGEVTT